MKAGDGLLIELARKAGVRPPHIFHLAAYRAQMKERFSIDGYCAFAMMERKHVERMIQVLDELPSAKPRQARKQGMKHQLPDGWVMPEEWLLMGRELRFWTLDVCRTEAAAFEAWHRARGNAWADWKAAWRSWITKPWKENGTGVEKVAGQFDSEDARRAYLERMR